MARWFLISTVIFWNFILPNDGTANASSVSLFSSYHINDKKSFGSVDERFLSYTLEPEVLSHIAECRELNTSSSLFRSLLPAYLRIAGSASNKLLFQLNEGNEPPLTDDVQNIGRTNFLVTGPQWLKFINFVNETGFQLVVSLNGGFVKENADVDLTNALEFISYSNKNNLDLNWELGYEVQKIKGHGGRTMGRDVSKLRKILDVFPRYRKSLILGPDMTDMENRADIAFVRNYLSEAANSLDAFTVHYDFSTLKETDSVYNAISPVFNKMEAHLWIKEGVPKTVSKGVTEKKSVWLGESETKDRSCSFSDALSFVQRLGASARLGTSVYLRKPHLMSLFEPTSEYWVALFFKSFVGKTVLDAKFVNGNNTKVFAFAHCTRVSRFPDENIINPNVAYDRGAVTLYGANTGSEWTRLFFRLNSRYDQLIHIYVLTENKDSRTKKTLLNRQELRLSEDNELPIVSPKIREYAKYVLLPPESIFFLVLPYADSRACASENADALYVSKRNKKASSSPLSGNDTEEVDFVPLFDDGEVDDGMIYVTYPKKQQSSASSPVKPRISKNTKFITYSDDTWLSPLPDQLKEIFYKGRALFSDDSPASMTPSKKEKRVTKVDNYRIITQALLGKRNVSRNASEESSPRSARSVTIDSADEMETESPFDDDFDENRIQLMRMADGEEEEGELTLDANTFWQSLRRKRHIDDENSSLSVEAYDESPRSNSQEDAPMDVFGFDVYNSESIRASRGVLASAAPPVDEHSTPPSHPATPLLRRSRRPKTTKASSIVHRNGDEVPLTPINETSDMSSPTPAGNSTLTGSETSSVESVTLLESSSTGSKSENTDILAPETIQETTLAVETASTADEVPAAARSMINEPLDEVSKSLSSSKRPAITMRPRMKPTKLPTKHVPVSPTKRSSGGPNRVTTPSATSKRKAIRLDPEPTTSDALSERIRQARAKLQRVVDANRARIKALKEERMQRKLLNPDPSVMMAPRRKRNAEGSDGRNLADDVFDKAKDVSKDLKFKAKELYSDVSSNVHERLRSITRWMEDKYKDIKKELTSARGQRDLSQVKKRIREYSEEIRRELAMLRERSRPRHMLQGGNRSAEESQRKVFESVREFEPLQVDLLRNRTLRPHRRDRTTPTAPAQRMATVSKIDNVNQELVPGGTIKPLRRTHHTSQDDDPRRLARSLVISNDIYEDNRSELDFVNPLPVADRVTPNLDSFEMENIEAKLRELNRQSTEKVEKTVDITEKSSDYIGNDIVEHKANYFESLPKESSSLMDENNCQLSTNIVAYLWCKCKDFIVVMIRAFGNDSEVKS